jgi:hypothetical protein
MITPIQSYSIGGSSAAPLNFVTSGQSRDSRYINSRLSDRTALSPNYSHELERTSVPEMLYDVLAEFKVFTSQVAMHLELTKRDALFRQLDLLLDPSEWPDEDLPPAIGSFRTMLRTVLFLAPQRMPSLGVSSSGRLIIAWTARDGRLTVDCYPNDRLRWSLTLSENGERRAAAGDSSLRYLRAELTPYDPARWFG